MTDRDPTSDVDRAASIAVQASRALWANDRASQALGMTIDSVGPGAAVLSMAVREDMVNGHDLCHGGFIFLLADSALAFASNSYNQRAVAQHNTITFIESALLGDRLIATATERSRRGRSGIYDVTVARARDEKVLAELRGHTRIIPGSVFDDD